MVATYLSAALRSQFLKPKVGQLRRDMVGKERKTREMDADYILELEEKDNRIKVMDQISQRTLSSTCKVTMGEGIFCLKVNLPYVT